MVLVLAPYDRHETAAAAMMLAGLIENLGFQVRLGSADRKIRRVTPYWDSRVLPAKSALAAAAYSHVITFGAAAASLAIRYPSPIKENSRPLYISIPGWCDVGVAHSNLFAAFDKVVCGSEGLSEQMVEQHLSAPMSTYYVPWQARPAAVTPDVRDTTVVYCDSSVLDISPESAADICAALCRTTKVPVTVCLAASLPTAVRRYLWREGFQKSGESARLLEYATHQEVAAEIAVASTYIHYAMAGNYMLLPRLAAASGARVLVPSVNPFHEMAEEYENAFFVPGEYFELESGQQFQDPETADWAKSAGAVLRTPAVTGPKYGDRFAKFWGDLLQVGA